MAVRDRCVFYRRIFKSFLFGANEAASANFHFNFSSEVFRRVGKLLSVWTFHLQSLNLIFFYLIFAIRDSTVRRLFFDRTTGAPSLH